MVSVLVVVVGLLALIDVLFSHAAMFRSLRARSVRPAPLSVYPSITVIRPVRGLDEGAEQNFAAALNTGYPGEVETLFVFDDEADPGLPAARTVIERHVARGSRGRARILIAGSPPPGRTGKVNAMAHGVAAATGELIAFGDSDTRPDGEVLAATVEALLADPRAGASFAPIVVSGSAAQVGDAGYAFLINGWYGPAVAHHAARHGHLPFVMGQLMIFRKEALAAIGGVSRAEGQLVDDMHLGIALVEAGYRIVLSARSLEVRIAPLSLPGFVQVFRRWMIFSRTGMPFSFTHALWRKGIQCVGAFLAVIVGLSTGNFLAALAPAAALVAFGWGTASLAKVYGGEPLAARHAFVPYLVPLFGPLGVISSLGHRQVEWRGRTYALGLDGRLATPSKPSRRPPSLPPQEEALSPPTSLA